MKCILCFGQAEQLLLKEDGRIYFVCTSECHLIFLDPSARLSVVEEKERYDLHNNNPDDEGYRDFLRRLTNELMPQLGTGARGLDFGCGPGPALSGIMREAGFECADYDPLYYDDRELLNRQYDFITATEVFEHLYDPRATLKQLAGMLKPAGTLAVMTDMVISPESFEEWWYHTDPTHVSFYSRQTFDWIAQDFFLKVEYPSKNVVLFRNIEA